MENLDWAATEAKAKKMTDTALHYAVLDCRESVRVMGNFVFKGKDAGYYRDELSVYSRELTRRGKAAA